MATDVGKFVEFGIESLANLWCNFMAEVTKMSAMNHMKRILLIVWGVLAIFGLSFGVIGYKTGDFGMHQGLEISDFHICSNATDLTSQVTSVSLWDIRTRSVRLFACGVIIYHRPERINIYVYKEPSTKPIDRNQPSDTYDPGEWFFPIDIDKIDSVGEYRVVVYFYRYIVGETSFTVTW